MATATTTDALRDTLIKRRRLLFSSLTKMCDDFKDINSTNIHIIEAKYQRLPALESELAAIAKEMFDFNALIPDAKSHISIDKENAAALDLVDTIRGAMISYSKTTASNTASNVNTASVSMKLPSITLPTFDSSVEQWKNFISLFDSLVHTNPALSNVQKFHYLRSNLKGEALASVSNFVIDDANYLLAYDALVKRYQNERRLANYYLQQILCFKSSKGSGSLQQFLDTHENSVNAIKRLGIKDLADYVLFQLCYNNLDANTQRAFDVKQTSNNVPAITELLDHVRQLAKTDELKRDAQLIAPLDKTKKPAQPHSLITNQAKNGCPHCQADHKLYMCSSFKEKPLNDRYAIVRQNHLCFGCLGNHDRRSCQSSSKCKVCQTNRHHTLLHGPTAEPKVAATAPLVTPAVPPPAPQTSCLGRFKKTEVLLGPALVLINDAYGKPHRVRAVIDSGSQVSFITSSCAQRLGLRRSPTRQEISGLSQSPAFAKGSMFCHFRSIYDSASRFTVSALILDKITAPLPSSSIPVDLVERFRSYQLADPAFYESRPIDMLLSADLYAEILSPEPLNLVKGEPTAVKTALGWIIVGKLTAFNSTPPAALFAMSSSLEENLKRFWESETDADQDPVNPEDVMVEQHFVNTHRRLEDGRYVVSLPFKSDASPLQNNSKTVMKRYESLEKRLNCKPDVKTAYNAFLKEYLELGHMEPAKTASAYVMPHHCVFKTLSDKVRVVFNGSFPDQSGISLNQRLCAGPKLQQDISNILLSFRLHEVALCADIKMMYRQIRIEDSDRHAQHIYWRPAPEADIQEFELTTVTYGLAPSAFQSQRTLLQLVQDEGSSFPQASKAVSSHCYVDDVVYGSESVSSAIELYHELTALMAKGHFELRKWSSSHDEVLQHIPAEHRETPVVFSDEESAIKILGLMWEPSSDSFRYHVQDFEGDLSKRSVLSYIARFYDPMGWLSPVVFWVKHFLQVLWKCKLAWDQPLSDELSNEWLKFVSHIRSVTEIRIPRRVPCRFVTLRLVGFSDASDRGYSCVLYLHCESNDGEVSNHLLKAKSRVAPLKPLTIPRLELLGALMLSHLTSSVKKTATLSEIQSTHLYTDSAIVLAWLKLEPHTLKTLVANRITEIQTTSAALDNCTWNHVRSAENPADVSCRGTAPQLLKNHPLWWHGPDFIQTKASFWSSEDVVAPEVVPEVKPNVSLFVTDKSANLVIDRFSSLQRLVRVVALSKRLVYNFKNPQDLRSGPLLAEELKSSLMFLVALSQEKDFSAEIKCLKEKKPMKSPLAKLSPFLDEHGFLRVGGRLRHSSLPSEAKHPLLLRSKNHLSELICKWYHVQYLHGGSNVVQSLIQQKFWITSLRSLLRHVTFLCPKCFRLRAAAPQPPMADLPPQRVLPSRPFSQIGLDYAGPFDVKESTLRKSRHYKGYLLVIVDMAIKATHLEFVSDMTTQAFLAAFTRFTSRRGLPSDVYSDQGRNFVGAAKELREVSQFLLQKKEEIQTAMASLGVKWHFNPPYAPNFGCFLGGCREVGQVALPSLLLKSISRCSQESRLS